MFIHIYIYLYIHIYIYIYTYAHHMYMCIYIYIHGSFDHFPKLPSGDEGAAGPTSAHSRTAKARCQCPTAPGLVFVLNMSFLEYVGWLWAVSPFQERLRCKLVSPNTINQNDNMNKYELTIDQDITTHTGHVLIYIYCKTHCQALQQLAPQPTAPAQTLRPLRHDLMGLSKKLATLQSIVDYSYLLMYDTCLFYGSFS